MIELNRHIEILLLSNECVIVPDFGGFMAHQVSARYDADDHSFLPPFRTLGFNPQLRMNDSVLVQSYVEAYDISYPEALRRVNEEVEELKQRLNEDGTYTMSNLGTLTVNQEGNYEFAPFEAGILSPDYYGLSSFYFKRLRDDKSLEEPKKEKATLLSIAKNMVEDERTEEVEIQEQEEDNDTLHIKMSWVRNAVAAAAAIIAFFLLSTPVVNSDLGTRTMSQLQNNIIYKLMPKDSNVIPAEPIEDTLKAAPVKTETVQKSAEIKETPKVSPIKTTYYVIVASQVKKSNAEQFVESLQKKGFSQAEVFVHNKIVRVAVGQYETEAEAYRFANKLHQKEGFEEAWVYKQKVDTTKVQAEI